MFESVLSQIGIFEFSRVISMILFFIYTLFKYLSAPLCKLKLLLVQGFESTLISLGDFQRYVGDRGCTRLTIQFNWLI